MEGRAEIPTKTFTVYLYAERNSLHLNVFCTLYFSLQKGLKRGQGGVFEALNLIILPPCRKLEFVTFFCCVIQNLIRYSEHFFILQAGFR